MTTLGLCTHFSQTDRQAFNLAFRAVKTNHWQLTVCHWLYSPYRIRRDIVGNDLFKPGSFESATPQLLNRLELQLRTYNDSMLEDFTDVAFKLCEGQYQVELTRCFRNSLLDLVVMGYPTESLGMEDDIEPIEEFALKLNHPLVIVGRDGPESYLVNASAENWSDRLGLPEGSWKYVEPAVVA